MLRRSVFLLPAALCGLLTATPSAAQDSLPPSAGGMTTSLGQPPERNWFAGASADASCGAP